MKKYIHLFQSTKDYENKRDKAEKPWVSYTEETGEVKYNEKNYLTFEGASELEVGVRLQVTSGFGETVYVSTNDGSTWTEFGKGSATIYLGKGQKLLVKGYSSAYGQSSSDYTKFNIVQPAGDGSQPLYVYGNIMSLIDGDNFEDMYDLYNSRYTFASLFKDCYIQEHPTKKLLLPATRVGYCCYHSMFLGSSITKAPDMQHVTVFHDGACFNMYKSCYRLTVAPKISNASIGENVFDGMFSRCTSLTEAPELPILTLAGGCYQYMFEGCTALVKVPELPATTLSSSCYSRMFKGCTSLVNGPKVLPATVAPSMCYVEMFMGCTKLTNAPKILATQLGAGCFYNMFANCTSLTKAPDLLALSINNGSYGLMFSGCSKLSYVKAMFTTNNRSAVEDGTAGMLSGVATKGTFVKNSAATWENSWVIPEGWTVKTADN